MIDNNSTSKIIRNINQEIEKQHSSKPTITKTSQPKQQAPTQPVKSLYDVKVEVMLPATLTYRILADNAQQASELIKNKAPSHVKYQLVGKRDLKMMVYKAGTNMLEWIKNLAR